MLWQVLPSSAHAACSNLVHAMGAQVGKDVLTMSLPAELLLPCTELQKQAEELVREQHSMCV
jgi:hypothetical protein